MKYSRYLDIFNTLFTSTGFFFLNIAFIQFYAQKV